MPTKEQLRTAIKKKFKTLSNFAIITEQDRYELQKLFARKNPDKSTLRIQMDLVKSHDPDSFPSEITKEQVELLRDSIGNAGGVLKFCLDNPQFSKDSVFQILSGRRKRMTPKVKEVFEHLEILV